MRRAEQNGSTQRADLSGACDALAEVLDSLCEVYERIEEVACERREAIRGVDHRGLASALEREQGLSGRLVMLNQRRMEVVRAIEGVLGRPERGQTSVRWIEERLEAGGMRDRLGASASRLRELIGASRGRIKSDRLATDRVCAHIRGILHAAMERLNHAGTYGSGGTVESRGGPIVSAMDVTS
ncbi:MAG: flagellar protein FlgN [Planctomycetota bacterium]|jgi:hypothetical protein